MQVTKIPNLTVSVLIQADTLRSLQAAWAARRAPATRDGCCGVRDPRPCHWGKWKSRLGKLPHKQYHESPDKPSRYHRECCLNFRQKLFRLLGFRQSSQAQCTRISSNRFYLQMSSRKAGKSPFHSPAVEVFTSFSFQILLFTGHLHHFLLILAILSQC